MACSISEAQVGSGWIADVERGLCYQSSNTLQPKLETIKVTEYWKLCLWHKYCLMDHALSLHQITNITDTVCDSLNKLYRLQDHNGQQNAIQRNQTALTISEWPHVCAALCTIFIYDKVIVDEMKPPRVVTTFLVVAVLVLRSVKCIYKPVSYDVTTRIWSFGNILKNVV